MKKPLSEMTLEELNQLFPVILSEYKPYWKKRYTKEKGAIEETFGEHDVARISHVGSTAVPGLLAKPTIDIILEIADGTNIDQVISNMNKLGYRHIEQPRKPPPHMMFVKGYTEDGIKGQVFHVHVRYLGDWDEFYFRDYLLAHPETAAEYAKLKNELKNKHEYDRDAYTEAKTEYIQNINKLAREEAGENC